MEYTLTIPEFSSIAEQWLIMVLSKLLHRFRAWRRRRFGVPGLQRSAPELSAWFQTPLGRAVLDEERCCLDEQLQDLFGYHLLQMGVDPSLDVSGGSRITHRVTVAHHAQQPAALSPLVADHRQLPLPSESVDLLVIHHLLDYSQTPHQLLREAERVLIPRGHLVIVGFNPIGGFGLVRWSARWFSDRALWRHQALRLGRLLDWLKLLDLEPAEVHRGFFRPPLNYPSALRRLHWLERWGKRLHWPGGAFYVVVACKEVGGAVPVKPQWQTSEKAVPGFGVNPLRRSQKTVKSTRYR